MTMASLFLPRNTERLGEPVAPRGTNAEAECHDADRNSTRVQRRDAAPMRINRKITARQREVLRFVYDHIVAQGFAPTIRAIGEHFGIRSLNGANDHLDSLERRGLLLRTQVSAGHRTLRVTPAGHRELDVVPVAARPDEAPLLSFQAAMFPLVESSEVSA